MFNSQFLTAVAAITVSLNCVADNSEPKTMHVFNRQREVVPVEGADTIFIPLTEAEIQQDPSLMAALSSLQLESPQFVGPQQDPTGRMISDKTKKEISYYIEWGAGLNYHFSEMDGTWVDDTFPHSRTLATPSFSIAVVRAENGESKYRFKIRYMGSPRAHGLAIDSDAVYYGGCNKDHAKCIGTPISDWSGAGQLWQMEFDRDFHFSLLDQRFVYQVGIVLYKAKWNETVSPVHYQEILKVGDTQQNYTYPTSSGIQSIQCQMKYPLEPSISNSLGIERGPVTILASVEWAQLWGHNCPMIGNGWIVGLQFTKKFGHHNY